MSDGAKAFLLLLGCAFAVILPSAGLAFVIGRAVAGKDNALLAAVVGVVVFVLSAAGISALILWTMCSGVKL